MFQIGDKIFYPMHGGGIIEKIEEKEIFGQTQLYYVVNIPHRNMQVMLPLDKTEKLGMRPIVDPDTLDDVLSTFHSGETETASMNDTQRQRLNMSKIKTGDICEEVAVIRDLLRIKNKRKLGMADKNMLDNARQILISEVVLVKDIPHDQATHLLDEICDFQ
ncbi:RNA polymerase-binding transcription factor CarD [Sporomusa ovata DSM 2662]|uniref:CarD-like transcriptional regulator n=1 Tax=Sporomusa ovata TaxID=2378 RepID=A0A0U1KUI8_9FIRM|nr:CarD family transcriptional regulator [Sporomusa ovata]EQB26685.1 transcriptional regulator, CarD family [Sporomusa ovata DSM 2662]CQR70779.1 CarD-like transcriptional regulator [Sporomusa ovata]